MEARDSGSKIRPLPIDDIDGDAPQPRHVEPKRRLMPLIVIVVGAIAFGVVARGLGTTDGAEVASAPTTAAPLSEVAETTTTTTTSPPRTLRQLLPVAADGLSLVEITNTSAKIGEWTPDSAAPSFNARISQPRSAGFNSDFSRVAIHTSVRDGSYVIDDPEGGAPIHIQEDVSSGLWHPTDPDLFAWTEFDVDQTTVKIADVSGYAGAELEPLVEFALAAVDHELLAWGDWGIVTRSSGRLYVFDIDGQELSQVESEFLDATPDGLLLLARIDDGAAIPYLLNPDGSETALPGLDIGASGLRITDDGAWVLAVTYQADGHTSILARTVGARSTRLTSINETAHIVDLIWEDRFLVLQEVRSLDLVFKDWNTGAEFRLPVENQIAAVGF
ncbi:MAG: hypothetical protein GY926_20695 [bacterium]|nr:hypothetical protein [bacterium]